MQAIVARLLLLGGAAGLLFLAAWLLLGQKVEPFGGFLAAMARILGFGLHRAGIHAAVEAARPGVGSAGGDGKGGGSEASLSSDADSDGGGGDGGSSGGDGQ